MGGSTETWVGSCLQDPTAEGVRNSNVARLGRHPLTGIVLMRGGMEVSCMGHLLS